jgi:hypothetical protein
MKAKEFEKILQKLESFKSASANSNDPNY